MRVKNLTPLAVFAVSLLLPLSAAPAAEETYDVVIYGGTSGGVTAAVQVKRMGKTAVLIEPTRFLGGLTTGGLGATDIGNKRAIGGLSREFYRRVHQHYLKPEAWLHETRDAYFAKKHHGNAAAEDTMWTFEPHVASRIMDGFIAEAGVPVVFGERLDLAKGVVKEGARIRRIVMESGRSFAGAMFIDASYEGDLMAEAGVTYHVGREANSVYGETLNGVQTAHTIHHQFTVPVDPYVIPGNPASGALAGIQTDGPGEEFSGDHRVQAYNFRMCTTDAPANLIPWEKPAGYLPAQFELLLRNCEAGDLRIPWAPTWMPNRKTDTNNRFAVSTDFIGMNYDYPDGDYATRARIWKAHEEYQKGLMWTLANHPRVPEKVRLEFQRLGLAKDEFPDNGHWPRQLYVRETRRMISDYVMTEKNCRRLDVVPDSVGMGAYNMDSHNVQRYITKDGKVRNEGDVQVASRPYPISFRSIRPRAVHCTNLLAPLTLSSSHIAFGSIRMEPVFMVLGQSAATAAVQALEQGVAIQQIDPERLKQRLLADGQVLDFESPPAVENTGLKKEGMPGIVLDDRDAQLTGFDSTGNSTAPFLGDGYRHDGNEAKGQQLARFTPTLPKAGDYEVRIGYSALANRATNVPIAIRHAGGTAHITLNQRLTPPDGGFFFPVGTYRFDAGNSGCVEIRNEATDGHVMVDAVQWLPR